MLSSQLSDQVLAYVDSRTTIRDLEDWIVPRLGYYLHNPHSRAADLVAAIELGFVELNQGLTTEVELRAELSEQITSES